MYGQGGYVIFDLLSNKVATEADTEDSKADMGKTMVEIPTMESKAIIKINLNTGMVRAEQAEEMDAYKAVVLPAQLLFAAAASATCSREIAISPVLYVCLLSY